MNKETIHAYNIEINPLTMNEAIEECFKLSRQRSGSVKYVVTPNLNHLVILERNTEFKKAYKSASLTLVDGMPVKWSLSLLGKPIPEVVPGSSLTIKLLQTINETNQTSIFLLGAAEGVAKNAVENIKSNWPKVKISGYYSPPQGFEKDEKQNEKIISLLNEKNPDIIIVGLGAPKQELWIYNNSDRIRAGVALCVGATIDFISGEKRRAPTWMQKMGMEWVYRIYTEPRRLFKRYLLDALAFPMIFVKQLNIYKSNTG
ncbi:MAG: WecB/TagA/CpsF family glycosyltransferase [Candidatus Thiodiazotropha sp.]